MHSKETKANYFLNLKSAGLSLGKPVFLCEGKSGGVALFDVKLWYPVALCAEIMWNCDAKVSELIRDVAQRPYVAFA